MDVTVRPHDRDWINYQEEIGLRHTPAKTNKSDNEDTPPLVPLRYLLRLVPVLLAFISGLVREKRRSSKKSVHRIPSTNARHFTGCDGRISPLLENPRALADANACLDARVTDRRRAQRRS